MKNSKLLIGTAALALVAGSGIAFSQQQERSAPGMSQGQGGAQAPAAQERGGKAGNAQNQGQAQDRGGKAGNAQNQGQAQGGKQGQAQGERGKGAETTGQAPPAAQQEQRGQRSETGQPPQPQGSQERPGQRKDTTGQQNRGKQEQQAPAAQNQPQQGQPKQGQAQQPQQGQPQQAQQPQAQPQQQGQAPRSGAETQGQAGARVQFSTEQRTRIRETIIRGSGAPRVQRANINFTISVGTVVPRTVQLVAVPTLLVEYHPAWRGYMYFIVDDEIIIVEPGTLRIVEVIAV